MTNYIGKIVRSLIAVVYGPLRGRKGGGGVRGSISSNANIAFGVSKGSIFGPMLFILYINDTVLS